MLIKNGFLIDPATKKSGNYDIRIKNGIITEIGNTLSPAPNAVSYTHLDVYKRQE